MSACLASRTSVGGDVQVLGEFGVRRNPAELVGQFGGRVPQLEPSLLKRALDVDLPALIAEVALDLAAYARLRIAGQTRADTGIEVVDRLEQANVTDLHELLVRLGAVLVAEHARPDERPVPGDEHLAGRVARLSPCGRD